MNMKPQALSNVEIAEIAQLKEVRDQWGCETPQEFMEAFDGINAVKFDFMSGSPGYCGDMYLLHGDHLVDAPPVRLVRRGGKLEVAAY